MIAVVLVGGFGTRLRPLTNELPKPVLPIANQPMITGLVERLAAGGVTDVVLALGFAPAPFHKVFPTGSHAGANLHYVQELKPLDTGGAFALAVREFGIEETFIAVNGDIVSDLDVADFVATHKRRGEQATIQLTPVANPAAFGVAEVDDQHQILRFVEKPAPGETSSNLINAGAYVLEPDVFQPVQPGQRASIERDIFPQLVVAGTLYGYPTDGYWIDTGQPHLFLQANLDRLDGRIGVATSGISDDATIDSTATITRSVIGAGCNVGAGASISNSVLLPGATVERDAIVAESLVAGRVARRAVARRAVIGATGTVDAGCSLVDGADPEPQ